jgi:hypothetical protein
VQAAWPVLAVELACGAWQFAQSAGSSAGLPACGAWQSRHVAVA